jgi:hypothetical protein
MARITGVPREYSGCGEQVPGNTGYGSLGLACGTSQNFQNQIPSLFSLFFLCSLMFIHSLIEILGKHNLHK